MDKLLLYKQLVSDVKSYVISSCNGSLPFDGYEKCDAINLWTYWQGRWTDADGKVMHNLDAQILVVGQDWGAIDTATIHTICQLMDGKQKQYVSDDIFIAESDQFLNPTDNVLYQVVKTALGYDISRSASDCPRNRNLFFTNFFACFREEKNTGYLPIPNINKEREFFVRLVELIQPKVVVCLGKKALVEVCLSLGITIKKSDLTPFHRFIGDRSKNPVVPAHTPVIFGMAHPGPQGTLNRVKDTKPQTRAAGIAAQIEDWKQIKPYLEK